MANVISGTDYAAIAQYYSSSRSANISSVGYLYDAVYTIVLSTDIYPTLDLISEFWNSYSINDSIFRASSSYLGEVVAINSHVLNRAGNGITSINQYLTDQDVMVPMGWAELCKLTGVLICKDNISDPPAPTTGVDGTYSRFSDGTIIPTTCS
jgi:hypothetical protein